MSKYLLLLATALLSAARVAAQGQNTRPEPRVASGSAASQAIAGRVTEAHTGEALTGVSVILKGTTWGTATNADGQYTLSGVPASGAVLQFKYLGYMMREMPVGSQRVLDATLTADPQRLSEVVVTATAVPRDKRTGCWGGGTIIRAEEPPAPAPQAASRKQCRQARKAAAKARRADYLRAISHLFLPLFGNQASRK
jgi:hypothetical protein